MNFTDYYKVLELEKGASDDAIKKAFRRLARQYHPDANPNNPEAEERFKQISEAYEVLGNPEKKAKYDSMSSQYNAFRNSGQGTSWQDFGKSNSFQFRSEDFADTFSGTSFGDLLSQLFGSASKRSSTRPTQQAVPKRRFQVNITLEEAYNGVTKRFTIDEKKVDIAFKPGIANEQRLRVPAGELEVVITPHKRFTRDGNNLMVTEHVAYTTAVLGGTISVKTLAGTVSMTIPPGSRSGKTFRLKAQGMPHYERPSTKGDLLVTIQVDVPSHVTPEQQTVLENLRALGL